VEAALEPDHRRAFGVRACELDRILHCFGAGVEERSLCRARDRRGRNEPLRQRDVDLVRNDREVGVEELRGLVGDRLNDARVRVTDIEAADPAGEVEEGVAVDVGEGRARAVLDHHRQEDREWIGDDLVLTVEDLLGARSRYCRLELDCLRRGHEGHDIAAGGRPV
jgi:hypothetical protein